MASNWISVQERLPEKEGTYLVYCSCDVIFTASYINKPESMCYDESNYEGPGFYDDDYDWMTECRCEIKQDCVTHWMPLPEPPKGE